jgi:hypothetical protein
MATLTETERAQLRRRQPVSPQPTRWARRPMHEYLAFLAFASRLKPESEVRPIIGGDHWKL